MENPWLPGSEIDGGGSGIDIKRVWLREEGFDRLQESDKLKRMPYSWFSVCCELIKKYDHVYADISYTLSDPKMFSLLKVILESNDRIRERVLFGTDFYVVAKEGAERELCLNLGGYLGEELFKQIAETNPKDFLKNDFNPIN